MESCWGRPWGSSSLKVERSLQEEAPIGLGVSDTARETIKLLQLESCVRRNTWKLGYRVHKLDICEFLFVCVSVCMPECMNLEARGGPNVSFSFETRVSH